jgi:septal ring factor EnvC (AmiA/AmiB activator)
VRTLYKLSAFGDLPFWVDEGARADALPTRGAARRVILRDLEERRILRAELAAAGADVERLEREAERRSFVAAPAPRDGSLRRPTDGNVVASFGTYNDERTHARLLRRGVELHAHSPVVVAAAAGQVRWAGPLRGLGTVVVLDHGQGLETVTTGLAAAVVSVGDRVAAGAPVGRAAGSRIGFEVRRGGRPVDPFPLLAVPPAVKTL